MRKTGQEIRGKKQRTDAVEVPQKRCLSDCANRRNVAPRMLLFQITYNAYKRLVSGIIID